MMNACGHEQAGTGLFENAPATREIRLHQGAILASAQFVQSRRLSNFLSFTVGSVLNGTADLIKEYTIGTEVYGRPSSYNPSEDSIVRTEARRLRSRLNEYYSAEGNDQRVRISYVPGSYVPRIICHALHEVRSAEALPQQLNLMRNNGLITLTALPFRSVTGNVRCEAIANGLNEELLHRASSSQRFRLMYSGTRLSWNPERMVFGQDLARIGVGYILDGTLQESGNFLRMTARICDANGSLLSSLRRDMTLGTADFQIQEELAELILTALLGDPVLHRVA